MNKGHLQFEMSMLYAYVWYFECYLHFSCKLDIKKWQACTLDEKIKTDIAKHNIQEEFHLQLLFLIKYRKLGFSNTKSSRRFLKNTAVSASIIREDENLTKRFHLILQVISWHSFDQFRGLLLQLINPFLSMVPHAKIWSKYSTSYYN